MASSSLTPSIAQWLLRGAARFPIPKLRGLFARLRPFLDDSSREFTVNFSGLAYKGDLSQYIDRQIFYFGCYSPIELSFLDRAAKILRSERQTITFIDVGANVGQHTLFMSKRADRILAFEPNNEVADRLQANIVLNGIGNIELIRCALGSEAGEGQLGSGLDRNSGSRSLVWSLDETKNVTVPIVTGDTLFQERAIDRVDVLKVDVEGYERNVFEGMSATLLRDRPVMLFELVGREIKGGFKSELELRSVLYHDAILFSLGGKVKPKLLPFDWATEEAVCLPRELIGKFADLMR